jgi:hypothetical protein
MESEKFQIDEVRNKRNNLKSGFIFLIITLLFFLICFSIAEQQKHSVGGLDGIGSGLGLMVFAFIGIINLFISLHFFLKSVIKKENKQQIISQFSEKPNTKFTWYAMYFGLAAFLIPIILNPIVLFIKDKIELPDSFIYILSGLNFTILIIGLIISITAFIKGERSWVMWVGLISCILMIPSLLLFFIFLPILK